MPNPRENRLFSDFEKVKALVSGSGGSLRLVSTQGSPPVSYVIEYHCPGLARESGKEPAVRDVHRVEINLGFNYPFDKPSARVLTPVFNPHIFASKDICLGGQWMPGETLDVLVLRIGALLQYDPMVLDARSPANIEANQWAAKNRARLPLGRVTFKAAQPPAPASGPKAGD